MPYKDLEKRRECRRRWYKKNKKSELEHIKKRKKEIKDWFNNLRKKLKCEKCGENHSAVLEFHHKNKDEKNNEVAFMAYYGYSKERIMMEMKKCQVLCSNCHKKVHYNKF